MPKPNVAPEVIKQQLENERTICTLYIDSAKSYTQLSTGALLLSLAYAHDFLSIQKPQLIHNWPLVITWLCWLLAVLMGITYQYSVVKYLETMTHDEELLYYNRVHPSFVPKPLIDNPSWLYGFMMLFFYVGIVFFSYVAVAQRR